MKKIIDRKVYDTKTAECLADECESLNSFYSNSEALYRTKKGAWFIYGESSAGGKYGKSDGNTSYGGEDIIPLSIEEAIDWVEQAHISNEERDELISIFSESLTEA